MKGIKGHQITRSIRGRRLAPDAPERLVGRLRGVWPLALWELAVGLGLALVLTTLFIALGNYVVGAEWVAFDRLATRLVYASAHPALTGAMRLLTNLGGAIVVVPIFALMIEYLLVHRQVRAAVLILVSGIGAAASDPILKGIFRRARPDLIQPLDSAGGYSFPSGHAVMAVVTFGLLAYLVGRRQTGWSRVLVVVLAITIMLLVGFTRVYLGVHYPTDVTGSLLVGGAWVIVTILALRGVRLPQEMSWRKMPRRRPRT